MGRYLTKGDITNKQFPIIGIWKIEESEEELISLLANFNSYKNQLKELHSNSRRKEWLATRVLLQELINPPVTIGYHANGAPFLTDYPLHISISHTKGYAAVLLQQKPNAGIDIEYKSERIHKIRSKFISNEELQNIDSSQETYSLLLHWCAKEALFKMIHCEEIDFKKHLHVWPHLLHSSGLIQVQETKTVRKQSFRLAYQLEKDFVLVWSEPV